jgi:Tfp pilus assembly protein PilV
MRRGRNRFAFALYEVLLGLAIFVVGVLALGRTVQNCLNASTLSEEENRVGQLLANRMAEVQASPGVPDAKKEMNVDTGYGVVKLIQSSVPANLEESDNTIVSGINRVTLRAVWSQGRAKQSKQVVFYVYRAG